MAQSAPREEAFELLPRYTSEHLRIQTLGQFRVRLPGAGGAGGAEPQWITPQSVLLLKCLVAAPGQELTHDELIELLWPECAPEQGRRRLRDALSKLRRALEPHEPAYGRAAYVLRDRQSLRLHASGQHGDVISVWLDAAAFEQLAEAAIVGLETGNMAHRGVADTALALYHGPFLPVDRYAEWSQRPRHRYHRLWETLLRRLVYSEIAARNWERAIDLLGALTDDAPDDEDAAYLAMVVHATVGRRAEALRIYHRLQMHLLTSLGTAPNAELQSMSETIRSGGALDDALPELR